jgi:hypothetical protein
MLRSVVLLPILAALFACPASGPPPTNNNNNQSNLTCSVGDDDAVIQRPLDLPKRKDAAALDLSCVGTPPTLSASTTATIRGCIKIFGTGDHAKSGIQVDVFDISQDPSKDTPQYGSTPISLQADANGLACDGADAGSAACLSLACDSTGAYSLDNIPLHIPLVVKVSSPGDTSVIASYSYDEVMDYGAFPVDGNGVVAYDANLIFKSTYDSIPTLSGQLIDGGNTIGDGQGRGVIAGEIHDCGDVIVAGATVSTDKTDSKTKVVYFNGNTSSEQPLPTQTSTASDGLYAILNVNTDPGSNTPVVSAGALDPTCTAVADCQCVSMSSRTVRVFPDSVTILTLRGDLPVIQ